MPEDVSLKQKIVTITATFVAAVIILAIKTCCHSSEIINGGIFIGTTALVAVAYFQLDALTKQTNANFLLTFNREFFDKRQNQKIIATIEDKEPLLVGNNGRFTDYQLDDYLGYFELMALFEKRKALDFESIYEMFGHYITCAWENDEVQKYLIDLRKEHTDNSYYEHFENLAKRVGAEDKIRQSEYKEHLQEV